MGKRSQSDDETNPETSVDERNEDEQQTSVNKRARLEEQSEVKDLRHIVNKRTSNQQPSQAKTQPASNSVFSRLSQVAKWPSSASKLDKSASRNEDEDVGSEDYEAIDYGDDDDEDQANLDDTSKSPTSNQPIIYATDDDSDENQTKLDDDTVDHGDHQDEQQSDDEQNTAKTKERCKFWPSCKEGDDCNYYHPSKPCRAFPNCRFGSQCLYVHPACKFNPNCTKPMCPFAHPISQVPTRRMRPARVQQAAQAPKCRYGYRCSNLMCTFSHQRAESCRFGANCLLESCPYTHPSDMAQTKPASAFKWTAQSQADT